MRAYEDMASSFREYRENKRFSIYPDIVKFADLLAHEFSEPRILDVGPGAGIFSKYFEERSFKTTAIDFSPKMIEVAREASPQTEYLLGNFLEYEFKGKRFEGIFAKSVIHLFKQEDVSVFFRKAGRLLANGGLFYVSAFVYPQSKEEFREKIMNGKRFTRFTKDFTRGDLERLMHEEKLRDVEVFEKKRDRIFEWSAILERASYD